MARIWKFDLRPHMNRIEMPSGAEILSIAFQGDDLKLWARVDQDRLDEIRAIHVVATGGEVDPESRFIGTVFHRVGLVFHVFDCGVEGSQSRRRTACVWRQHSVE
jgi:hypothetical protein